MIQINLTELDKQAIALIKERYKVSTARAIEIHLQLLARKRGIDLPPGISVTEFSPSSDDEENDRRGE
jgi:hypothetical protein